MTTIERGVYVDAGIGPNGDQGFVAVDTDGRRIIEVVVHKGVDTAPVENALWELLDSLDPVRRGLRVVR